MLERYVDGAPQDTNTAFTTGDLVVNAFNDDRQARLALKDQALELFLKDPVGAEMDVAGDGGPAFFGGPSEGRAHSMVRTNVMGPGAERASWAVSSGTQGCGYTNNAPLDFANGGPTYDERVISSPGVAAPRCEP